MIFSSLVFIAGFLPLALLGYALASRLGFRSGTLWLIFVSLVFYGFWAPWLIVLIAISMGFNYAVSVAIRRSAGQAGRQSALLATGIAANLAALIYYKYAFALLAWLASHGVPLDPAPFAGIVLPLGISFFTFTQIGYLVDCKDGVTKNDNFIDYLLFVTFFPHLIAGPIVHNGDLMPQFADPANRGLKALNLAPGLTLFVIGLTKKLVLADPLAGKIAMGFADAAQLKLVAAWVTALCYSFQLYFDFSGYSDMACGLALMFGVRFPANFNSPYRARNIIEFWQRWHMSLTRYLNQYLYNPIALAARRRRIARGLPMTRKALSSPAAFVPMVAWPTIATMGLAGVWHGAGLQFLIFGLLHGAYLTINHAWRMYGPKAFEAAVPAWRGALALCGQVALTYVAVLVGQVFFRAGSVGQALDLLAGMAGMHGVVAPGASGGGMAQVLGAFGLAPDDYKRCIKLALFFAMAWFLPNSLQIMAAAQPVIGVKVEPAPRLLAWRPSWHWAVVTAIAAFIAVMSLNGTSEFLYFQF